MEQRLGRFRKHVVFALVLAWALLGAAACQRGGNVIVMKGDRPTVRGLKALELTGDLAHRRPFPPYNTGSTGGRGRVFLVALGADVANFAQEVVDQREMWLRSGVSADQIVCYYTKPTSSGYKSDQAQFESLVRHLGDFYPASPGLIAQHLGEAAHQSPDWIYVYLTGHGSAPLSHRKRPSDLGSPAGTYVLQEFPELDDYSLASDTAEARTVNLVMKLHAAQQGVDRSELFLTPAVMHRWLRVFPASTRKIVVLQGCYSGGFLRRDPDFPAIGMKTLEQVANLVAVAAARGDRTSFGCDPGSSRTVFGDAWIKALSKQLDKGQETDWTAVYTEVREAVDRAEAAMNYPITARSRPALLITPHLQQGEDVSHHN